MRYRLLGRTGLRVSELCLGAMVFGDQRGWKERADRRSANLGTDPSKCRFGRAVDFNASVFASPIIEVQSLNA